MESAKQLELASRIVRLTTNNKLRWEETSYEDVFQVAFSRYAIRFSKRSRVISGVQMEFYVIEVLDEAGAVVDTFTDADLGNNWVYDLSEIYNKIRRTLSGAEAALDAIIEELDEIEPPSPPSQGQEYAPPSGDEIPF